MDLFRFLNPNAPTLMEQGDIITLLTSVTWIERYLTASEFTIVAKLDSNIRALLPVGSFISHTDTNEVMIVENHEVVDDAGNSPSITVTGRGYETFLENRIIGSNNTFPTSGPLAQYLLTINPAWQQALILVQGHIKSGYVVDVNDIMPYLDISSSVPTSPNVDARIITRGDLYTRTLEILTLNTLGMKVVRPGVWSPLGAGSPNACILIYKGVDRSGTVIFSKAIGDIAKADYLWSNKAVKNCVLVTGRWLETMVKMTSSGYNRRVMFANASDIDGNFTAEPVGVDRTTVLAQLTARGNQLLAAQLAVVIAKIETETNLNSFKFGVDYNVGDIVTVDGEYDTFTKFRVAEYVRILDQNGETGYPTLVAP